MRSPRRKWRVALLASAFGAFALLLIWWGFSSAVRVPVVPVETLVSSPVKRILAVRGRTAVDAEADVMSSVSARVQEVLVDEGDVVETGALLLALDDTQPRSRVQQALASLDSAVLAMQSAQTMRDRAVALGTTVSAVAVADAEQALAVAASEVDRQEAAVDEARASLAEYRITTPIAGVVLSRSVEPGDLVAPSTLLMRLANTESLHVVVQVDEVYADEIRVGQVATMQLAGRTGVVTGAVSFVASVVDVVTGSVRVKLSFDSPHDAQIGLTTVANILIEDIEDALTVPRISLVNSGTDTAVFVLRDGHAHLTPITYVDWPSDRVVVTSGLSEGDSVILAPDGVVDMQPVTKSDGQTAKD